MAHGSVSSSRTCSMYCYFTLFHTISAWREDHVFLSGGILVERQSFANVYKGIGEVGLCACLFFGLHLTGEVKTPIANIFESQLKLHMLMAGIISQSRNDLLSRRFRSKSLFRCLHHNPIKAFTKFLGANWNPA